MVAFPTKIERAGKRYKIVSKSRYLKKKYGNDIEIDVEGLDTDLWPNGGWGIQQGNPACLTYAMRSCGDGIGFDGPVWYGHIGHLGELIHESEFGEEVEENGKQ